VNRALDREITLRIDALAAGGDGVGRSDQRVVFVPRTAPGDLVRVELEQLHARFARARLVEVIEPGQRREPACPHFSSCGGCSWLHIPETVQSQARLQIVGDALRRIAKWSRVPALEHLDSPRALGYRARARVAYARGEVGFRSRGSHRVIPVRHCMVLDEETQRELSELWERVPRGQGEREIRGFAETVQGLHVGRGAFFQANRWLWQPFVELVSELCGEGALLLELYAGVGFFTAPLQARFERVIAVEHARSAADLARNTRAEVHRTPVEEFLARYDFQPRPDAVLLNPPRTGCAKGVLARIATSRPDRIVYVSCDPSTFARDLSEVSGVYALKRVVVLDALPQTHHVELVALLEPELIDA